MSDTTDRLWTAVDAITQPTTRRIHRAPLELFDDPELTYCRLDQYQAATLAYGKIPPLWDQATWAVFGTEAGDGSGGRSPLRERTPADLDLMETLLTIRESMAWQLKGRNVKPRDGMKAQMRQLASHLATHEPQHVEWWAYRFEQWARLLRTHLNALDNGPRDRYIRNTPCPLCKTRQVTIERDGDRRLVPTLVVDFVDGIIRAASCQACGHAWFRGEPLNQLADTLRDDTQAV
jgi:hypothetical protein